MKKRLRLTTILLCFVLLCAVLLAGCKEEAPAVTTNATEPSKTAQKIEENWGLSFAVEDITATGLTLVCTQSGDGQHLGELTFDSYMLYSYATDDLIDNKEGAAGNSIQGENGAVIVECDATGRVALDWAESIGTLPAGKYVIIVSVLDVFDGETVHPLTVKYQYHQDHTIDFDIP